MLGIAIIAMDRPQYLARLVASLEQQENGGDAEYHLWQDGVRNEYSGRVVANEYNWNATRKVFDRARLPTKHTHANMANLGVGLHQVGAIEWMTLQYVRVMVVEDDVVLSPHWLRLLGVLFDQFAGYPHVFGFCPGFKRLGASVAGLRWHDEHWWCEAFTSDAWARARLFYADYVRIIQGVDYRQRDNDAIRALFAKRGFVHPSTSQDAGKDMAIHAAGMLRVCCEVNRAMGIGKTGIHFTPALFNRLGYDNARPYTHASDGARERFNEPHDG